MNVVIAGCGLMGSQIALEYALGGHRVSVLSHRPDRAKRALAEAASLAVRAALSDQAVTEETVGRIEVVPADDLPPDTEMVVESLPEDLELKLSVLAPLGAKFPEATFASNTSSLSIESIANGIGAPRRTLGTHYLSPPLLMPPVELIFTESTEPSLVDTMKATLSALGKRPVVARDTPGFVWNRLQFALLREAAWLTESGVVSAREIDDVVREGLARRWRLTGPFEAMALGGTDTFESIAGNLFPHLSNSSEAGTLAGNAYLTEEELRSLRIERDEGLIADSPSQIDNPRSAPDAE